MNNLRKAKAQSYFTLYEIRLPKHAYLGDGKMISPYYIDGTDDAEHAEFNEKSILAAALRMCTGQPQGGVTREYPIYAFKQATHIGLYRNKLNLFCQ